MGIYPTVTWEKQVRNAPDGSEEKVIVTRVHHEPGLEIIETFERVSVVENRTDCFCCTCGDRAGSDPACRNHGYAGRRPCDIHNLPGQEWDDEMVPGGGMPEPVSVILAAENA
jgi:hypothetical protein